MIVLPNEGLPILCSRLLNPAAASPLDWQVVLWSNNLIPAQTTVWADLVESTVAGYSRVSLTQSEWTTPVVASGVASSTWGTDPIVWNLTGGPFNVYGWAAITPTASKILLVERFDDPLEGVNGPGKLRLLPAFDLRTYVPCP